MRRESADEMFLRRQEEILRDYNVSTANVTSTGIEVRLTPRLAEYVLGLLDGRSDADADDLRELIQGPGDDVEEALPEPSEAPQPGDELAARRATKEEPAGQEQDYTTYASWYSWSTPRCGHSVRLGGWFRRLHGAARTLLRRPGGRWSQEGSHGHGRR